MNGAVSRARIARLTLQLRAAEREADEAEAAERVVGRDDELAALRSRREALIRERREVHEAELAEARAEAAAELEAARRELELRSATAPHVSQPTGGAYAAAGPVLSLGAAELADAIASAMAKVLEQQQAAFRATLEALQPESRTPTRPRWLWRVMHLDIALSALAALVAVTLLLAWLG